MQQLFTDINEFDTRYAPKESNKCYIVCFIFVVPRFYPFVCIGLMYNNVMHATIDGSNCNLF
jgi:hypothetical protein